MTKFTIISSDMAFMRRMLQGVVFEDKCNSQVTLETQYLHTDKLI